MIGNHSPGQEPGPTSDTTHADDAARARELNARAQSFVSSVYTDIERVYLEGVAKYERVVPKLSDIEFAALNAVVSAEKVARLARLRETLGSLGIQELPTPEGDNL